MAKGIMMQGTASNAGKTLIAAGLCRIFAQDGYRVAPFKSQNMALNSFVTEDGLEMGRAQVMQAECAGVSPDVRMNPILLKPTSDHRSQVIVNGEVIDTISARDYYAMKRQLRQPVREAYESLSKDYDIVVLEGAGSPAEINLKEDDLANMGMAQLAQVPVLLVGDIDRGGVFAAIAGTHLLMEPWERDLFKGVIINKFRGDMEILRPGIGMLEERIGVPVLGTVPYLQVDVDDEDSLSSRLTAAKKGGALLDIAVIRLPRISNFTDFNLLQSLEELSVRYVEQPGHLGEPDLLILPGTKSTMADLKWLHDTGWDQMIYRHAKAGRPVIGICGGYQMLGYSISDPHSVESGGTVKGLGLLPVETEFAPQKSRRQVTGRFGEFGGAFAPLSHRTMTGYEIHMGQTNLCNDQANPALLVQGAGGATGSDGASSGNVLGCYVHGVFDHRDAVEGLVVSLLKMKGISTNSIKIPDHCEYKEQQYNTLADELRKALDMDRIYRIMEEGVG